MKISVIMPVYNSEKYLRQCADSILSQDFDSFELLLIDDGSTDGSAAICDSLAQQDSRVRVYHKANGGICHSRNFGLEQARGEYIAFSDHDDMVEPGFLRDNYEAAKRANADIVKFGRKAMLLRGDTVVKTNVRAFPDKTFLKQDMQDNFLQLAFDGAMTCVWDGLFRRAFLESHQLCFDLYYKKGGEDVAFCNACFARAEVLVLREKVYYNHYIRVGYSTSTKADDGRLARFARLRDSLHDSLSLLGIDRKDHAELYLLNLMKGFLYPSLSYFIGRKENFAVVRQYLQDSRKTVSDLSVSCRELLHRGKWGIYTLLFWKKQYRLMYTLLKCYQRRK